MVKYTSILIGVVVFSLFITMMFLSAGTIGADYDSKDAGNFTELSGEYEAFIDDENQANSTIRQINAKLDKSNNPISIGSDIIIAAIDGAKLFLNSLGTTTKVSDKLVEDSGGRIHPLFSLAVKTILAIVLLVIIVQLLIRAKAET